MAFDLNLDALQDWQLRRTFKKHRVAFYRDLGSALKSQAPINDLIREYSGQDIKGLSPMMKQWAARWQQSPASLARAIEGLVDEGDAVVIEAAERNPSGAGQLYMLYSRNLAQRKAMVSAVTVPLITPSITVLALIGTFFFFRYQLYEQMAASTPLKYWPDYAAFAYKTVMFITGLGGLSVLATLVALAVWVGWSYRNFTGPIRDWLDHHVFLYSVPAHMELLQTLIAMSSMVKAGVADTEALSLVSTTGSKWLRYQMDKVQEVTRGGKTVLTSLAPLPMPKTLAARVFVLARQERLANDMPDLVIESCLDESAAMVERMNVLSKLVNLGAVLFILIFVGLLVMGNIGYSEASQRQSDEMSRLH